MDFFSHLQYDILKCAMWNLEVCVATFYLGHVQTFGNILEHSYGRYIVCEVYCRFSIDYRLVETVSLHVQYGIWKCAMWNLEVCNFEVNTALTGHRTYTPY